MSKLVSLAATDTVVGVDVVTVNIADDLDTHDNYYRWEEEGDLCL